jgi:hypothetical protein
MDKYELLRKRADEFMVALDKYAPSDDDVADLRDEFLPWYEKIMAGRLTIPCEDYYLYIYFTNPDYSRIAEKYAFSQSRHPLHSAAAEFTAAIKDWSSMAWRQESHKER